MSVISQQDFFCTCTLQDLHEDNYLRSAEFTEYMNKRTGELREFLLAAGAVKP